MKKGNNIGASLAILSKVSTMAEGGIRITLDIPSTEVKLANKLQTLVAQGKKVVTVGFVKADEEDLDDDLTGLDDDDL